MMKLDSDKNKFKYQNKLLLYYQCFLAVAVIFIFFSGLSNYLYTIQIAPPPVQYFYGFVIAAIPLFFSITSRTKYLPYSIVVWGGIYLSMSCITIVLLGVENEDPMQSLEDRIRTVLFLLLMLLIFSKYHIVQLWTRRVILFMAFINVFILIYHLFNPSAFVDSIEYHGFGPKRVSGLYGNANDAAFALIIYMIFSINLLKPRYRFPFVLIVGLGILPTFSRGAMLCWLLTVVVLVITKTIPSYQIPYLIVVMVTMFMILGSQLNNLSSIEKPDGSPLLNEEMQSRIEWILDPFSDSSYERDTSRSELAADAWQKFAEKPFLGNGIDSSVSEKLSNYEGISQGTHNIYLKFMVEHGFLGLLIYPMLVLAAIWKVQGETKNIGIVFATNFSIWGMFSHSILNEFFYLIAFALMASMAKQSQLHQKY